MSNSNIDNKLERYWEEIKDDEDIRRSARYGGLAAGAVLQFAEHSPDAVEEWTGIDVPESLFEEVYNPYEIDKGIHFYFSYSGAAAMLDTMEKSDTEFTYPEKAIAVNTATITLGSLKEFSDNKYDPWDMAANLVGANTALYHHKNRLLSQYEEDLEADIDSFAEFIIADSIYNGALQKGVEPQALLQED